MWCKFSNSWAIPSSRERERALIAKGLNEEWFIYGDVHEISLYPPLNLISSCSSLYFGGHNNKILHGHPGNLGLVKQKHPQGEEIERRGEKAIKTDLVILFIVHLFAPYTTN